MERYRIHEDASLYFVTFTVVDWLPVFVNEEACSIIADSFAHCDARRNLGVNAYVIMPTHLHGILFDKGHDPSRLAETLTEFRKYTGRTLLDYAAQNLPKSFTRAFREAAPTDRTRRFWQPSRHPEGITSRRFWEQKLNYLHDNPCRKGLVRCGEDWRFSSARHYRLGEDESSDVPITEIEW